MAARIEVGDIVLDVIRKDIRNIHLSVYPPTGRVRVAVPERMKLETIRLFAISKLGWIRQQQRKLLDQERETPREYLDRESHYVWGRRVLMRLVEANASASVQLNRSRLVVTVRPGTDEGSRAALVASWYRNLLRTELPSVIAAWEQRLGVTVNQYFVQQMKTRWGSCNPLAGTIRLNTELAKKPRGCLEYIVVHEICHLIEPTHGPRFLALMDQFLPAWRETRMLLNSLPARHERWGY